MNEVKIADTILKAAEKVASIDLSQVERKAKGLTQIALQMQTGIEQALLSKFENGGVIANDFRKKMSDFSCAM